MLKVQNILHRNENQIHNRTEISPQILLHENHAPNNLREYVSSLVHSNSNIRCQTLSILRLLTNQWQGQAHLSSMSRISRLSRLGRRELVQPRLLWFERTIHLKLKRTMQASLRLLLSSRLSPFSTLFDSMYSIPI